MNFNDYYFDKIKNNLTLTPFHSAEKLRRDVPTWVGKDVENLIQLFSSAYLILKGAFGSELISIRSSKITAEQRDALERVSRLESTFRISYFPTMPFDLVLRIMGTYGWVYEGPIDSGVYLLNPEANKDAEENGFLGLL